MKKIILGLSAFYHDSAAALVVDGKIIAAAQEERFSRIKHDANFPIQAVNYCLKEAGVKASDITDVIFYEKPLLKLERILETHLAFAPRGLASFMKAVPQWLEKKLFTPREIDRALKNEFLGPISFVQHHQAHAASAFFPSPFQEAAILTLDGVGEWSTVTWGIGSGNKIELKEEIQFPHSIGLLYSAFTYYTGFKVNSGEYKLMGLAPYGSPKYAPLIFEKLIDIKDDGSFWLDQSYFNYCAGLTMTSEKFHRLFGGPPRASESPVTQKEMDIAASIQLVTEEIILRMARYVHRQTGAKKLCLAGGVALNCVANGRLLREGPFSEIWVQPAAGDAGGALGAALFHWHQINEESRTASPCDSQQGSLLGPAFSNTDIEKFLQSIGANYRIFQNTVLLDDQVAELLEQGKVVGLFQGRMEFGPRALGARSIIADPRNPKMQSEMNLKIKFRESFRPFAPSCSEESIQKYFDLAHASPYMLLVAQISPGQTDKLPAITHVDSSARVQSVNRERNGRYYDLIKAFEKRTGCAVLVNTSFNIRGEPIVCRPEEAYRSFMFTDIDALVLEDFLLLKSEQQALLGTEDYKRQFTLD